MQVLKNVRQNIIHCIICKEEGLFYQLIVSNNLPAKHIEGPYQC